MLVAGFGIGLGLSVGLIALINWRLATRRTFMRDVSRHLGMLDQSQQSKNRLEHVLHRVLARSPQAPWGSDSQIDRLLSQSGDPRIRSNFRTSQLIALCCGLAALGLCSVLRQITHHQNNPVLIGGLLFAMFPLSGWLVRASLEDDVTQRAREVNAQLPGALELLAFSVSAGEPVMSGLHRVSRLSSGALSNSLALAVTRINSGTPMSQALRELAMSARSTQLARAVHAIDLALERGTPLADVLRAQASDARAQHARELMVIAGKKETAMLLPVVFLILPMIVLVAIYPGLIALKVL